RAAREVAERGRPDPDAAEFRRFAELLVRSMESEPDVVSIGSLYYNDSGPHLVSRGVPAARPSTLGRLELVSHGEHLRQAAASLGPPIERIKSLGRPGAAPVVPIETLAPAPPPPPARPATQPARPAARPAAAETPDLVGSWAAYERMVQAGVGPASLEELVALKGGLPKDSLPVVDVRTLLYRGQQALKRAQELRAAAQHASNDSLRALV